MIIRYNWDAIKKHTKSDINKILKHFRIVYVDKGKLEEYLLNNEYARKIIKENTAIGLSFMSNIEAFLENF